MNAGRQLPNAGVERQHQPRRDRARRPTIRCRTARPPSPTRVAGTTPTTALVAPGQLRRLAEAEQRNAQPMNDPRPVASDVAIAATEYQATPKGKPRRVPRRSITRPGDGLSDGVGHAEGDEHPGEVGVGPLVDPLQLGAEHAQCLPVDVVDDGGEEEQPADVPPKSTHATRHRGSCEKVGRRKRVKLTALLGYSGVLWSARSLRVLAHRVALALVLPLLLAPVPQAQAPACRDPADPTGAADCGRPVPARLPHAVRCAHGRLPHAHDARRRLHGRLPRARHHRDGGGHSTMLTGATPTVSGIIDNAWYERSTKTNVESITDTDGRDRRRRHGAGVGASPRRLLVPTLGDQLKLASSAVPGSPQAPRVIGISLKDRSAILPAGHAADAAYFFRGGRFVTSTYYRPALPAWVEAINARRIPDSYAGKQLGVRRRRACAIRRRRGRRSNTAVAAQSGRQRTGAGDGQGGARA